MKMSPVLLILILSWEFLLTTGLSRGDQGKDILLDEDIKEMTYEDLEGINTESNTSSFDIVDESSIDAEMNADRDQDPEKTNWMIVLICCIVGFILILLTMGALVLYNLQRKGNQVLDIIIPWLTISLYCF